ncbi:MAG: hypothetical protein MI923_11990 [Phycisphaerales bacterium]|nr:hypothetical protein [Phycisphaerales bacterium]
MGDILRTTQKCLSRLELRGLSGLAASDRLPGGCRPVQTPLRAKAGSRKGGCIGRGTGARVSVFCGIPARACDLWPNCDYTISMVFPRVMCLVSLVSLTGALNGLHRPSSSARHETGYYHAHQHSHHGHTHTHWHRHRGNEGHGFPEEDDDHHEVTVGHDASEAIAVMRTQRRNDRRLAESKVIGPLAAMTSSREGESPAVPPPKRPPRSPGNQDDILHLRTIVLLT